MNRQLVSVFWSAAGLAAMTACSTAAPPPTTKPAAPAPAASAPAASAPAAAAPTANSASVGANAAQAVPTSAAAPAARITPLSPPLTLAIGSSTAELPYGSIVALERGYFKDVGIEL